MLDTKSYRFLRLLQDSKKRKLLTQQQFKTIRGQVLAGNFDGAVKGYNKLLIKQCRTTS